MQLHPNAVYLQFAIHSDFLFSILNLNIILVLRMSYFSHFEVGIELSVIPLITKMASLMSRTECDDLPKSRLPMVLSVFVLKSKSCT